MGITGAIIVFIIIWWIIFFSVLPIGIKSKKNGISGKVEGEDPGAPQNPYIFRKFIYTTLITIIIFSIIYYIISNEYFNLSEYLN